MSEALSDIPLLASCFLIQEIPLISVCCSELVGVLPPCCSLLSFFAEVIVQDGRYTFELAWETRVGQNGTIMYGLLSTLYVVLKPFLVGKKGETGKENCPSFGKVHL